MLLFCSVDPFLKQAGVGKTWCKIEEEMEEKKEQCAVLKVLRCIREVRQFG
jgi:hypothetical protein